MTVPGVFRVLVIMSLLAGCAARPATLADTTPPAGPYKAVLVAGDSRLPVFDNAVQQVAERLRARGGVAPGDIQRLSAAATVAGHGARLATLDHILAAVAAMKPRPGQGCFVFATSHGAQGSGLWLEPEEEFLTPQALDRALTQGCGGAPTAVVISGCFSGIFTQPPMARANRVVLAAARADRTSFGCGAGRDYTVYDRCLLDALDGGGLWRQAHAAIQNCVAAEERRERVTPSEPQAWFAPALAELAMPVR